MPWMAGWSSHWQTWLVRNPLTKFGATRTEPEGLDLATFEREVLCELIRLHATMLLRLPWVQAILAVGIALLVYRSVPVSWWGAWGLLTVGAECLRAHYAKKILGFDKLENPNATHWALIALAAGTGTTVGLAAVLFMSRMPLPDQALLVIILFAMPAAGVSVAVSSKQILAAYALFIMVPAGLSWALLHPSQMPTAVGLTALYWSFIIMVAGDGEQLLRRSVAIRSERDRMLRDLELRNAEVRAAVTKAEQSSQVRARVLAAASHDLRQPLHALSVYSAILVANPSPKTLPEVSRNIDRLVRNLGSLLHGLLDLSRLSTDQYMLDRQRISLDRLAADVCKEYETQAREKQLRLVSKLEHVRLHDDPVVIGRIIRNLLDNAIKYTESGEVSINTYIRGETAVLTIEDTGKGIPEDEQGKIFEEFYQLDNPGRDYGRGVGLGLAIVQRLCEVINAEISLTSTPGVGTRFQLTFQSLSAGAIRQPVADGADSKGLQGQRVYIVDDEADILQAMSLLLSSWGMRVEAASSVRQAGQLFERSGPPDLLIVDLRLASENGMEMSKHLQRIHGDFPVLVVTGETAAETLDLANTEGYPLLQKPIIAEVLFAVICSTLQV